MTTQPKITAFFDETTFTVSYIIHDPATGLAAILDSVLDFDPVSGRTETKSADQLLAYIRQYNFRVEWILETHAHADHLSAAHYLKKELGGRISIGAGITRVQDTFSDIFNFEDDFTCDGQQFDQLFEDGETFSLGTLTCKVMTTPGHTPACITYCIGDNAFVGDTLFMPDFGTARADFPGGDAAQLYRSIRRILALPKETTLYMCHDYKAPERNEFAWVTSVAEQRKSNIHVHDGVSEADYVAMRTAKDKTLCVPRLILPAIQINIRAGALPPAQSNGRRYLKLPLNTL